MNAHDNGPALRISGPADLLQAVPYLLGFHPSDSLVLIGLDDEELVVTARLDLLDLAEPDLLSDAIAAIVRGGTRQLVGAVFDAGPAQWPLPWSGIRAMLERDCAEHGCELRDVLRVADGHWWSYLCESTDCCPSQGVPLPGEPSPFVAAATYAGQVALPDRAALAAQLEPRPLADRTALDPLIERAENAVVQEITAGRGDRVARSAKRALFAAARNADRASDGTAPVVNWSDEQVCRFAEALTSTAVRDAVWMAIEDARLDGRDLWRDIARRVPGPYDAAPLFLYGWASWRAGNGALAGVAAHRAVESDPTYSAADLLLAALAHGLDPRRLPRLRLPRSA